MLVVGANIQTKKKGRAVIGGNVTVTILLRTSLWKCLSLYIQPRGKKPTNNMAQMTSHLQIKLHV